MSSGQFWLILGITLLVGALLFMATGFIYVHKNHKAVIEKDGEFYDVKGRGLYYFLPFKARRVGMYRTGKYEEEIKLNDKKIVVTFTISDFKKYHYNGHSIYFLVEVLKEDHEISKISDLEALLPTLGVEIVKIKEK